MSKNKTVWLALLTMLLWGSLFPMVKLGFSAYEVRPIIAKGERLGVLQIAGGECGTVDLLAAEDFSFALQEHEKTRVVLPAPGFVYAPVARGQEAGYAYVCLGDTVIGKVALVLGDTVELETEEEMTILEKLKQRIRGEI